MTAKSNDTTLMEKIKAMHRAYNERLLDVAGWKTRTPQVTFWQGAFSWALLVQQIGLVIFTLFALALLLQAGDWSPFGLSTAYVVFAGMSFMYFGICWVWCQWIDINFLWFRYGYNDAHGDRGEGTEKEARSEVESRRIQRLRSFNMFMVIYLISFIYNVSLQWSWLDKHSKYLPTHVGGNTPNTPPPSSEAYFHFYGSMVVFIYTNVICMISLGVLSFRIWDDPLDIIDTKQVGENSDFLLSPNSGYAWTGYLLYTTLVVYAFVLMIGWVGTTHQIFTQGLFATLLVAIVLLIVKAFIFHLSNPTVTKNLPRDQYFKIVTEHLLVMALLAFGFIFWIWAISSTSAPEFNNGHIPHFEPARAAIGQRPYYYYYQGNDLITTPSLLFIVLLFTQHCYFCSKPTGNTVAGGQKMMQDMNKFALAVWVILMLAGAILFGFMINELCGAPFLSTRDWYWTIFYSVAIGVVALLSIIAFAGAHHVYTKKSTPETALPSLIALMGVFMFAVLFAWPWGFYLNNYNVLNKGVGAQAAIKDLSNKLSVLWPKLLYYTLLLVIPFLYSLIDFVSHPVITIRSILNPETKKKSEGMNA